MSAIVAALLPIVVKALADGTAVEIVATVVKLLQLLLPFLEDPAVRDEVAAAITKLQVPLHVAPAQPEDPAMQHAAGHTGMGGR